MEEIIAPLCGENPRYFLVAKARIAAKEAHAAEVREDLGEAAEEGGEFVFLPADVLLPEHVAEGGAVDREKVLLLAAERLAVDCRQLAPRQKAPEPAPEVSVQRLSVDQGERAGDHVVARRGDLAEAFLASSLRGRAKAEGGEKPWVMLGKAADLLGVFLAAKEREDDEGEEGSERMTKALWLSGVRERAENVGEAFECFGNGRRSVCHGR